jgi:hypothetical protein
MPAFFKRLPPSFFDAFKISALAFAAGEQPIPWTSQFDLIAKSFGCEFRQREFRPAAGRLGLRNPKDHVAKVDLILPRGQEFLADAKPVSVMMRTMLRR